MCLNTSSLTPTSDFKSATHAPTAKPDVAGGWGDCVLRQLVVLAEALIRPPAFRRNEVTPGLAAGEGR